LKGQISIEFMSLLAITLLGSSILVTQVNDRAVQFSESVPYKEAQLIGQKVSYTFDYVKAEGKASKKLQFNSDLAKKYKITVKENSTTVGFDDGNVTVLNRYSGPELNLDASKVYEVSYNGSYHIK